MRKTAKRALDRLSSEEQSTILKALLAKHPDLRNEAEGLAQELLAPPVSEHVADDVEAALAAPGIDALNARTGSGQWGYVEPGDAAAEILSEAIEDVVQDMVRRMSLGLEGAGVALRVGTVLGLRRADQGAKDGVLGWDPDFPKEHASTVVLELLKACPEDRRAGVRDLVLREIEDAAPEWCWTIARATEPKARRRSRPG
jgi:hypothetical protein